MEHIRTEFEVIDKLDNYEVDLDNVVTTSHWSAERKMRHAKITETIGKGNLVASFVVYTAHRHGDEIHNIFDNGIILIQNEYTKFLVTELIARPKQITRYWENMGIEMPQSIKPILEKARENQKNGYNNW